VEKNGKMEVVSEEMEDEIMEGQMYKSTITAPTQTSARLVAKLKKLMEIN